MAAIPSPAPHAPPASRASSSCCSLGDLELMTRVAESRTSEVWLARRLQVVDGRRGLVAVKLATTPANDAEAERVVVAARWLRHVMHPNLPRILGADSVAGVPYVVEEWVDGANLAELVGACTVAGERVPLRLALEVVSQVCDAVATLHEQSLGELDHGRLAPEHVMLSRDGVVKLVGLPFGREARRPPQLRHRWYQAPEHRGTTEASIAGDVYGVGQLLHLLATGVPRSEERTPESAWQALPGALAAVINRALDPKPSRRFASVRHLGLYLARLQSTLAPTSQRDLAEAAAHCLPGLQRRSDGCSRALPA